MTSNRLGAALPIDQQYEIRVEQETLKPVGVRTPEGKFYPFVDGEQLIWERVEGASGRKGIIRVLGGADQDFNEWMLKQDQKRV